MLHLVHFGGVPWASTVETMEGGRTPVGGSCACLKMSIGAVYKQAIDGLNPLWNL